MKKLSMFLCVASLLVACSSGASEEDKNVAVELSDLPAPPPPPIEQQVMPSPNKVSPDEGYKELPENPFLNVKNAPLSTFSIDVDRASYSNVRRMIESGIKPPKEAVRIEEMVNYFDYEYPQPQGENPIALFTEVGECKWNPQHQVMLVAMQGKKIDLSKAPASNLVFLLDVSGSMNDPNKLPLLKQSLGLLVNNLRAQDKVSIVVYAGAAGLVLPAQSGNKKEEIIAALNRLEAGGSTAGGEGLQLAYKVAKENFIQNGNNRIILATDGDFNVGINSESEMEKFITEKRAEGIFLTCLGFGDGNYKDDRMELLADKGNGNYAYIDNLQEAKKTLVAEMGSTLFTIAKDVKLQVEFNPNKVKAYRLIGYENRILNAEDFKDNKKDAGELGAGHTVTALYELIPVGVDDEFTKEAIQLKYQKVETSAKSESQNSEWATVKFRYKHPSGGISKELSQVVAQKPVSFSQATENYRFASAVALFGLLLRESKYAGKGNLNMVKNMAEAAKSQDKEGYKGDFLKLVAGFSRLGGNSKE
ncbi:MAG: vWA domain-containing protein [Bacteroidia bacterium]